MHAAPPRARGRAIALALAIAASSACADEAAERCEDGRYCPAGTRCGEGGLCLVDEAACAAFGPNAPCFRESGAGFCGSGECRAAVTVSGRIAARGGDGPLVGIEVAALDRAWMRADATDSLGGFALDAVAGDTGLVLRAAGDDERLPALTRRIDPGPGGAYELNGDATVPLRVPSRRALQSLAGQLGIEPDPGRGAILVELGSAPGRGLAGGRAALSGPTARAAIYFDDTGQVDPARTATSAQEPCALFVELEPGAYSLTASRTGASACPGAGADAPDPIQVDVRAGEVTVAGWAVCRP